MLLEHQWYNETWDQDFEIFVIKPLGVTNFLFSVQELRSALPGYEYGLFDQTALAFLLKTKPALMSKVSFTCLPLRTSY
jgi:hypothetical protein